MSWRAERLDRCVMPFPWTLQRYIFKEMGKTFLLTGAALTGVLGLGGGVFHMIKLGEATPGQLVLLMGFVLPVAAALTLPIALLFSAAATYGRLSGDNEFVACRSGGINMHVLFLPAAALGLASTVLTFLLSNFVIPQMVGNLDAFIAGDVGALIQQRLHRPRGLTLGGKFRIYADDSEIDSSVPNRIVMRRVAFAEVDQEQWIRFGTAREVILEFDPKAKRVSGRLIGLSYYDRKREGFVDVEDSIIGAEDLPSLLPTKLRFLNLGDLLHYRNHPGKWLKVRDAMAQLRLGVGSWLVYKELADEWLAGDEHEFTLRDGLDEYAVWSKAARLLPRANGLELTQVVVQRRLDGDQTLIRAKRAIVEVARGDTTALADAGIRINLYDVTMSDGHTTVQKTNYVIGPVPVDPRIVAQVQAVPDEQLLFPSLLPLDPDPLADRRVKVQQMWDGTVRRVQATLNERAAFSVSACVLVILGAALGIVFRGSHVLTAFGISFVPSLVAIIAIVMGKQMAHNASTPLLGLLVMWSGIALVALLDLWMLTRVIRR